MYTLFSKVHSLGLVSQNCIEWTTVVESIVKMLLTIHTKACVLHYHCRLALLF